MKIYKREKFKSKPFHPIQDGVLANAKNESEELKQGFQFDRIKALQTKRCCKCARVNL